jgi:hypothetical protein
MQNENIKLSFVRYHLFRLNAEIATLAYCFETMQAQDAKPGTDLQALAKELREVEDKLDAIRLKMFNAQQ